MISGIRPNDFKSVGVMYFSRLLRSTCAVFSFAMDDIELTFDEDVFEFIVDKALEFKLGARGLRSIVEAVMMDAMYSMPSANEKTLHVTLEYAKEKFEKSDVNRLQMT